MTSLSTFPSDLLGLILDFEGAEDRLLKLWRTGDLALQHKLSRAVRKFSFWFEEAANPNFIFNVVSKLQSLQALTIGWQDHFVGTSHAGLHASLRTLPPSLTELSLSGPDFLKTLMQHLPNGDLRLGPRGASLAQWSDVLPNLTSLEMHYYGQTTDVDPESLHLLPPSLTRLCAPCFQLFSNAITRPLPESIVELNICLDHRLLDESEQSGSWNSTSYIYPASRSLDTQEDGTTKPWSAMLPRHLTSLELSRRTPISAVQEIAHLPRTLTRLRPHMRLAPTPAGLAPFDASVWPPHLHDVALYCSEYLLQALDDDSFPSSIKTLSIKEEEEDFLLENHSLPSGITELDISFANDYQGSVPPSIPSTVTKLTLGENWTGGISESTIASLPPSITELDLMLIGEYVVCEPYTMFTLPPKLTNLRMDGWHVSWTPRLPASLTELDIRGLRGYDVEDPFAGLPASLKALCITGTMDYEDATTAVPKASNFATLTQLHTLEVPYNIKFFPTVLQTIGPSMTSLSIAFSETESIQPSWLPKGLQSISLPQDESHNDLKSLIEAMDGVTLN